METNYQDSSSEDLSAGMPLFRFDLPSLAALMEEDLDINLVWTLEVIARGVQIGVPRILRKFDNWKQTLIRKQFLTREGTVSTKGAALLAQLGAAVPGLSTYRPVADLFKIWWNSYPPTATFTHKGVTFTSTQVKRIRETLCRQHWNEILLEGKYTAEQIVQGTSNHLIMAMDESVQKKENRVHYVFNSERYIRERCFASYIEIQDSKVNHDTIDI